MQELRQAVKQWIARGKRSDLLWRGSTAQEALALIKRHVLELSAAEKEFLKAVRSQAGASRRRRVAAVTTIIIALAVVAGGGSFLWLQAKQAAQVAEQKTVEANAQAQHAKEAEGKVQAQL